jgi:hypothetical protein
MPEPEFIVSKPFETLFGFARERTSWRPLFGCLSRRVFQCFHDSSPTISVRKRGEKRKREGFQNVRRGSRRSLWIAPSDHYFFGEDSADFCRTGLTRSICQTESSLKNGSSNPANAGASRTRTHTWVSGGCFPTRWAMTLTTPPMSTFTWWFMATCLEPPVQKVSAYLNIT